MTSPETRGDSTSSLTRSAAVSVRHILRANFRSSSDITLFISSIAQARLSKLRYFFGSFPSKWGRGGSFCGWQPIWYRSTVTGLSIWAACNSVSLSFSCRIWSFSSFIASCSALISSNCLVRSAVVAILFLYFLMHHKSLYFNFKIQKI